MNWFTRRGDKDLLRTAFYTGGTPGKALEHTVVFFCTTKPQATCEHLCLAVACEMFIQHCA